MGCGKDRLSIIPSLMPPLILADWEIYINRDTVKLLIPDKRN